MLSRGHVCVFVKLQMMSQTSNARGDRHKARVGVYYRNKNRIDIDIKMKISPREYMRTRPFKEIISQTDR